MDINVDLISGTNLSREYELPIRSLDAALSREESGWGKYVLVDAKRYVVGYKYSLLNEGKKEIANIAIVKGYEELKGRRGLRIVHKELPLNKILSISEVESLKTQQLRSGYHLYPQKVEEKKDDTSSQASVVVTNSARRAKNAWLDNQKIVHRVGMKSSNIGGKKEKEVAMLTVSDPLQNFRRAFLAPLSSDVERRVEDVLGLAKPGAEIKINNDGWVALLVLGLASRSFEIYFTRPQDKP